jgi:cytoskeletal protein RodZ
MVKKVGSFGDRLRREREMRGISLDEIIATTKIGRRLLVAIEEEHFDLLPGGIFNKAYVRAYAKCVGIDEEEAVAEYLQSANEAPPDTRVIAQQHASIHSTRPLRRSGSPILPILILLFVIAGGIGGWKVYQERQKQVEKSSEDVSPQTPDASVPADSGNGSAAGATFSQAQPSTTDLASTSLPQPSLPPTQSATSAGNAEIPPAQPVPSPPASQASDTAVSPGASFEITVRPTDSAWVSIKSDGKYVVRGIIRPPDVKTVRASSQVVFYTGNAGAVDVSFNGKNVPLTGGANQEQVLVFDPRGLLPDVQSKTPAQ